MGLAGPAPKRLLAPSLIDFRGKTGIRASYQAIGIPSFAYQKRALYQAITISSKVLLFCCGKARVKLLLEVGLPIRCAQTLQLAEPTVQKQRREPKVPLFFAGLDGPIRGNDFRVPELNPFSANRVSGHTKLQIAGFEAIRANHSNVIMIFCESTGVHRPDSCCESPGYLSLGVPPFSRKHPQDNFSLPNVNWHRPKCNFEPSQKGLATSNM